MQQPHHSLTLWVTIPSSFKGSNREWLHRLAGRQHLCSENSRYCKGCAKYWSKVQLTSILSSSHPPLSEQQEEGRDLSCEQETEMKGSVCSLHSSSKVNPSHQLLPTQASPELKSSLRIPRQDSQRVSHPFSTHSPTFHLQLSSKSTNKSMLVPRGQAWRSIFASCMWHWCVRGAG